MRKLPRVIVEARGAMRLEAAVDLLGVRRAQARREKTPPSRRVTSRGDRDDRSARLRVRSVMTTVGPRAAQKRDDVADELRRDRAGASVPSP